MRPATLFDALPEPSAGQANGKHRRYSLRGGYVPQQGAWFYECPSHWQVKRLKYAVRLINRKVEPDSEPRKYVGLENIESWTGREIAPEQPSSPDGLSSSFQQGDVLFGKLRPYLAKAWIADRDGICTSELLVLRPHLTSTRYLLYQLLCNDFVSAVDASTYGSKMPRANWDFIGNLPFITPPSNEQDAIVAFLDRETARIDRLIVEKLRLIELLAEKRAAAVAQAVTKGLDPSRAMKPSEADWLGDVPVTWSLARLRFLFTNLNHLRIPLSGEDRSYRAKVYPYYGASGVIDAVDEFIFDEPLILVAEDGANLLSRSTPLAFIASGRYWVNNHAHILRPRVGKIEYWEMVLQTYDFTPLVSGSAQPKLTIGNLNDVLLPVPPDDEQDEICDYIDSYCAVLTNASTQVSLAIERLREYRAALITAAVTGQIDIRGTLADSVPTHDTLIKAASDRRKAPKANKFFYRDVLAAEIVSRIGQQWNFGWVKLQKSLILAEGLLRLGEIQSEPVRAAAGPFDNKMMRSIHSQMRKAKWYCYEKSQQGPKYTAMEKCAGHREYFDRYWGNKAAEFDHLMKILEPLSTKQAEIVATLFSPWNDFIIENRPVTDDALVAEVLNNWDPAKNKIPEEKWRKALPWMRERGLVPTGYGQHTINKMGNTRTGPDTIADEAEE